MTVSELIMHWTEEERKEHAKLITECLEREQRLNNLKGKIEELEKVLLENLDQWISGLSQLSQGVDEIFDRMENTYLYLAKAQGNA
jgi:predicted nuclease with TOPRIM domain